MVDIFSIYRAPFRADKFSSYIWDADGHMVADMKLHYVEGEKSAFRIRGWGRIQYMKNSQEIMDALEAAFNRVTADHPSDHQRCVDALNRLWEERC